MALVNGRFLKLPGSYLLPDITKKINTFRITYPKQDIIRPGIGDITRPLSQARIQVMYKAVDRIADVRTSHGYDLEQGHDFLIGTIIKHNYVPCGIHPSPQEIFINDGAKSDTGNIDDIFRRDNSVGVIDPIYLVYIDSNATCERAGILEEGGKWSNVTYTSHIIVNNFILEILDRCVDTIYFYYPNNPTGITLTKPELKEWVDYVPANDTLILFNAACEALIQEDDVPHSIYEIKGAKKRVIEFRSSPRTAGFTGVRYDYIVVPKELTTVTLEGERILLNKLWNRRQYTKFDGTSCIAQRAAEAIYTPEGKWQVKETTGYYMDNARTMKKGLEMVGLKVCGGVNAPYIWLGTSNGVSSWKFFRQTLYETNVVETSDVGLGPGGEGYIRPTAFGTHEGCVEVMRRIRDWLI